MQRLTVYYLEGVVVGVVVGVVGVVVGVVGVVVGVVVVVVVGGYDAERLILLLLALRLLQ